MLSKERLASLIDHTLLKPDTTTDAINQLCKEAEAYGFWSVCVNPSYVPLAARILRGTRVKICSVVGFPLGSNTPEVKALEARKAIGDGADEIDMVVNLGALKSGDYELVRQDIKNVVAQREPASNTIVKVIIEAGLLSDDEKILLCGLVRESGANFVKTSTGFNAPGAAICDVKLIRRIVGPDFGVKASGGIRTYSDAVKLIEAGANRIGTSSGVAILEGRNK